MPAMIIVPVALGFLGVYLMLPQARRSRPLLGALCGGAALLLAGWYLVRLDTVLPETILFYAFSGSAVIGGGMVIAQKNPVHAALSFALVILSTCGLFLLQGAPFLMAATVIVYAGAIVVTFLFVIMLAQQAGIADADQRSREPFLASLAGFVLIGAILGVLQQNYDTRELDGLLTQVRRVAEAKNTDEVIAVMGDPAARSPKALTHPLVDRLSAIFPDTDIISNLESEWLEIRQPKHLQNLQAVARGILALGSVQRAGHGSLTPSASLPLSKLSGVPANMPLIPNEAGVLPERLPALNVAAVGASLFTDHLLAVVMAGMLLLVATIGAIVIAGRRAEGLR